MGDEKLWAKLGSFPVTRTVNEPLLASVAALVQAKLVLLQRAFYAEVSQRMVRAGDPIQRAGNVVNGSSCSGGRWSPLGCRCASRPTRRCARCSSAPTPILAGSDADGHDSLLDDVQDMYAFFSGRPEDPPPTNIAADIATLAAGRATALSALLAEIVKAIEENGEPEPPDVFAPTLLRLRCCCPDPAGQPVVDASASRTRCSS